MIIKIILFSSEIIALSYLVNEIINLCKSFYLKIRGPIFIPNKIKKFTILRSPNGDKDSRICFKLCNYKNVIYILGIKKSILKKIMLINISPMITVFMRLLYNDNI